MTDTALDPAAADIEYHYDVGNEFYALWLDETLTYSAARWDGIGPDEPEATALASAQRAKFAHHLDTVGASCPAGGFNLLDVGCGWGGLMDFGAASGRVTEAKGLTLSRAQFQYVEAHARPGVRVELTNWEDHRPERLYDGIISVGAFEHFAAPGTAREERIRSYRAYFERCHQWLRPGGRMSLQTIAYDSVTGPDGPVGSFVTKDVFPGGQLPRLSEIAEACDPYFSVTALHSCADDYARTLAVWSKRLSRAQQEARELVGPEVLRRYRLYLRVCETTFLRRAATVYRIGFQRRDEPLRTICG
ncbi:SAM-dependent methyltransferase [Kitasatospora kifunensis]|uniref:Cyclopropane-fatty-acyl-phospholipid synthase n=1 Tax=Kitasatospora kifunensis TaxID=58351 RepID=A0A7W7R8T1_KITKI|nr:cyclopropane-fatty-acyl-phospholipid synthase family protein [Kitasatospora kifunensis]MBB4927528.1 cyclopropane-fatty-acyl-phospholipid synthase [Kitasatospora kifunensis]